MYKHSELTQKIIGAALEVHKKLGPGFLENIYHNALKIALQKRGIRYESEKEYIIFFENREVGRHYIDLLVENSVVVELKAVAGLLPDIFTAQVISYLKASNLEIGLLLNFGNKSLDIKRLAHYFDY